MIENKVYFLKKNPELQSRIGGWLYNLGRDANFELSETDVRWIERNITSHRLFRVIEGNVSPYGHSNTYAYVAEFFLMFLDTPETPVKVNKLLVYVIGICKTFDKNQYEASIEPTRIFFIQRWMEICR